MIVLGDEVVLRQMKLQAPRMGHDLVPRPNLIDRLDDGLDRSMTLVSAPPGFGKTTVLSEWFMRCPIPAAWLSLDEQDNDLVSFLVYFIAAVGTIFPKSFVKTQDLLHAPNLPQLDSLADTISEELDNLPDDFVLVMDNFRNIVESSIHQVLYMILERNPSRMHLVIASRADPPSPITRMRIGEQLAELRSVDLRFSKEETQLFFEKSLGHILDDEAIIHLTGQSDGWIVRLRLISISIRSADDNDAFLKMLDEKPGNHMINFLLDEALSNLPETTREFLIRNSILDILTPALCADVIGTSESECQEILSGLENTNFLFSIIDNHNEWFFPHELLRDLLRNRMLRTISEMEFKELHNKASEWFTGRGFIELAISHALHAGDQVGVAILVEDHRHVLLDQRKGYVLEKWLHQLPEDILWQHPALLLAWAWLPDLKGKSNSVLPILEEAGRLLEMRPDLVEEIERFKLHSEIDTLWSRHWQEQRFGT